MFGSQEQIAKFKISQYFGASIWRSSPDSLDETFIPLLLYK